MSDELPQTVEEIQDPLLWIRDPLYESRYGRPKFDLHMADTIMTEYRNSLAEPDMRPAGEQMVSALANWRRLHPGS